MTLDMWDARRILTAAALAAGFGLLWLVGSNADSPSDSSLPSSGSTPTSPIGPDARRAASAPAQRSGETAPAPPGLDFTNSEEVARAYLVTAHSVSAADQNRTNRRVLPYLAPTNPDNPRGLVVTGAPPAGKLATAVVDELAVAFTDEAGRSIAYQATWSTSTGAIRETQTTYVVLQRQSDGRWLVTQESARLHPGN
ncbi:hypothetical protein [Amycolatopsis thermoflava]|uniref:hypothetical protein n=1 Tax=Amycolatopsis thermoflava TaxID=84480 RepID=UPI0037FF6642